MPGILCERMSHTQIHPWLSLKGHNLTTTEAWARAIIQKNCLYGALPTRPYLLASSLSNSDSVSISEILFSLCTFSQFLSLSL